MDRFDQEDDASRRERLGEQQEAALAALLHDLQTLPEVKTVHDYGATIEFIKNMLATISQHLGSLKETVAALKDFHTKEVRGEKATLNDKDKKEVARRCAEDETLQQLERTIAVLSERWTKWDARRSRLNRDFEIAKTEFWKQSQMAILDAQKRHADEQLEAQRKLYRDSADYFVNKLRNAL
jgi:predicted nuclease with TOPRIM domain